MNIKQNYKKIIGINLIVNLIVISLCGVLVLSQTSDTFTISSGIYPQASYTIWREGNNYFSKNIYGVVVSQGINASLVIQTTVNLINHDGILTEGGGSICFLPEHYDLDTAIDISEKRGLEIFGLSISRFGTNFGAVLSLNDNANDNIIYCNNTSGDYFFGVSIYDLTLYGNKDNQSVEVNGIYIENTFEVYIRNVVIHYVNGSAIRIVTSEVGEIKNCLLIESEQRGLTLISCNHFDIIRNNIEKSGTHAIYCSGNENNIEYNIIADSGYNSVTGTGIYIDGGYQNTIDKNVIARSFNMGVELNSADNNTVTENQIYDNQYGVYITGDFNLITINHLLNNTYWGVSEVAPANYNTIALCHAFDNGYGGMSVTGANTHVNLCWNSTSWIS